MARSSTIRRAVAWTMVAILVASIITFNVTRDAAPRRIRIATAAPGGLYHKVADALRPQIAEQTGSSVTLLETEGTPDNCRRLLAGTAELAILQSAAASMDGLVALAPLYHDVLFVVARKASGISHVRDLPGHSVAMGLPQSGMHVSAAELLAHYDIDPATLKQTERYFLDLLTDPSLDAAIITTGLTNPDLEKLLGTGGFDLIPMLEAEAFCIRHPAFTPFDVPRGLYTHGPAVPDRRLPTVATTAFLGARRDVSGELVRVVLQALYESDVRAQVPTLLPPADAAAWKLEPLHAVARNYFDPYGGIDTVASFMESLASGKELLFAFGAGLYLLWDRWRRINERERIRQISVMKERLDVLLAETTRIERAQMETVDRRQLKTYLDEITTIKLKALDELTHEDLRGDRMFLIFLMQCGNVISKIQAKITIGSLPAIKE